MASNPTTQLFLSLLIFAPGLVLLVGALFIGFLALLEKLFAGTDQTVQLAPASVAADVLANPKPGRIVTALKASMQEEAQRKVG